MKPKSCKICYKKFRASGKLCCSAKCLQEYKQKIKDRRDMTLTLWGAR